MSADISILEVLTPKEIEAVQKLFLRYREGLWQACQLPDSEWQGLPGPYDPPSGGLLLAVSDGRPAGCVGLRPFPQMGTCEMKRLFVSPEFRGQRLGEMLITAVIRLARERGYQRMRLDTHPATMGTAVTLYLRFGFRDVDAAPLKSSSQLAYMELVLNDAQPGRAM